MGSAILTHNLTKYYKKKPGCLEIHLDIPEGAVVGLLGPNGAGKSTIVKLLTGLIRPTSGTAMILGIPAGTIEAKRKIGYLPELFRYQEWMTGLELLTFHGELAGIKKSHLLGRANEMLILAGLEGQGKYRVGTYSKGMQQRAGLAAALMGDPAVVFLDEPTSALDPIGRIEVRKIVSTLKSMGKTVLLNSHLLTEVEQVCDRIAFIKQGRIIKEGTLADLVQTEKILKIRTGELSEELLAKLTALDANLRRSGEDMTIKATDDEAAAEIAALIVGSGCKLYEMDRPERDLEAFFVNTVQGGDGK